jgi:predicted enzyme related to lactoylglutathione lyase
MPVRLTSVVFQAEDVDALVYYWTSSVDEWRVEAKAGGEVRIVPSEEDGSTLDLTFSPGAPEKSGKNRMHLDLNTWGMHEYQASREALPLIGGRVIDIGQGELVPWTVFADPEGNEFCLLKPRDRYSDAGAIAAIVVDCGDPELLATFWGAATGWDIMESAADFATLRDPRQPARGPFLEFSRVADRSPGLGRLCLGFESYWAHQHDADVDRLCELGARVVRRHDGEVSYSVLADPEGNEFRVVIPVWPPPAPERWRYKVDGPALHS